ncbi:hypothetical protein [Nocardia sp. NPDC056000]
MVGRRGLIADVFEATRAAGLDELADAVGQDNLRPAATESG